MTLSGNNRSIEAEALAMIDAPGPFFGWSATAMHSVPRARLEELQLAALRIRFEQLRDRIPVLRTLAEGQRLTAISGLDDVVPVLFPHTLYKSYPLSLLEKSRFPALTAWLQKLTTSDLSQAEVSQCGCIDDWLAEIDRSTPLWLIHSSGTSGTMSFLPRSKAENEKFFEVSNLGLFQAFGDPGGTPDTWPVMHVVQPTFRSGGSMVLRSGDNYCRWIARTEERMHALYPGRMSSDLVFLSARIRAAAAKGELDRLTISPQLAARRAEFEAMQQNLQEDVGTFFRRKVKELRGEKVFMSGTSNVHFKIAREGVEAGLSDVFAPGSILQTGGGAKGEELPANWAETVRTFLGIPSLAMAYGMSETMARNGMCERGRYHIEPTAILFVLDPETGAPLPRTGEQTGRAAFFDLLAETYWGGFVTGDEVRVDWSSACGCGRTTPHIAAKIERYSEMQGGDDKISCAAQPDAHRAALHFLGDVFA